MQNKIFYLKHDSFKFWLEAQNGVKMQVFRDLKAMQIYLDNLQAQYKSAVQIIWWGNYKNPVK